MHLQQTTNAAPEYSAETNPETKQDRLNNELGELVKGPSRHALYEGAPLGPAVWFRAKTVSLLGKRASGMASSTSWPMTT